MMNVVTEEIKEEGQDLQEEEEMIMMVDTEEEEIGKEIFIVFLFLEKSKAVCSKVVIF